VYPFSGGPIESIGPQSQGQSETPKTSNGELAAPRRAIPTPHWGQETGVRGVETRKVGHHRHPGKFQQGNPGSVQGTNILGRVERNNLGRGTRGGHERPQKKGEGRRDRDRGKENRFSPGRQDAGESRRPQTKNETKLLSRQEGPRLRTSTNPGARERKRGPGTRRGGRNLGTPKEEVVGAPKGIPCRFRHEGMTVAR